MVTAPPTPALTLREAYLRHHPAPADQYAQRLLLDCMPVSRRPLAALVLKFHPAVLAPDLDAIQAAGAARSVGEVERVVRDLRFNPRSNNTLVRRFLGVRASGRRLRTLARRLLPAPPGISGEAPAS